jgi:peptidoglycan/LPS O-acetylase OafA/YrhL
MPGIDGLRAIAVAAVFLYHAGRLVDARRLSSASTCSS